MQIPQNLWYSKDHEWLKIDGEIATVGITDFAQSELSDIVYVEIPTLGQTVEANQIFGNVEATKASSDLFLPLTGTIVEVNNELNDHPEWVNNSPYEQGWIIKVKLKTPIDTSNLLTPQDYEKLVLH